MASSPALSRQPETHPAADDVDSPAVELVRRWKGKAPANGSSTTTGYREPLTLSRLPIDILRLIFKELHDIGSGELVTVMKLNSTFHNLAAPYVYSSFDIIWPDETDIFSTDGVDALTIGLTALAHRNRFAHAIHKVHGIKKPKNRLLQNNYALYTRSFCMGNGFSRWVGDYALNTETGRMLNTLVAIAVEKMINLESFKWDMPTGLNSDVFLALASLDDESESRPCKLNSVWIRWGISRTSSGSTTTSSRSIIEVVDGTPPPGIGFPATDSPPSPPSSAPPSIGSFNLNTAHTSRRRVPYDENQVVYPTFSVLPALRSITVLDIDQVAYLDELSVLIEKSRPILRELRLSLAKGAKKEDFAKIKGDLSKTQQVDFAARWPGESDIGGRRLGGVLGVVLGRVFDIRKNWPRESKDASDPISVLPELSSPEAAGPSTTTEAMPELDAGVITTGVQVMDTGGEVQGHDDNVDDPPNQAKRDSPSPSLPRTGEREEEQQQQEKLCLERLEVARIPLHTFLCTHAFDWTVMTSLTILQCPSQEKLFRALRKQFQPTLVSSRPRRGASKQSSRESWQYHLKLKHIHVDITTYSLLFFLKETLAPNSIEVLFLLDRRRTPNPPVPIGHIFNGPIKRQHASLKKLLIDSSHPDKLRNHEHARGDARRMFWAFNLEMVMYLTSGKMANLRELAISLDPLDWHTFLQRLPNIPHLVTLSIPSIGRGPPTLDTGEYGLQIVDMIAVRPETRLRYLGIRNMRYEIVESREGSRRSSTISSPASDSGLSTTVSSVSHPSSDVAVEDEDEIPPSDDESDLDSHPRFTPFDIFPTEPPIKYRLKEILYADESVEIFKARKGVL